MSCENAHGPSTTVPSALAGRVCVCVCIQCSGCLVAIVRRCGPVSLQVTCWPAMSGSCRAVRRPIRGDLGRSVSTYLLHFRNLQVYRGGGSLSLSLSLSLSVKVSSMETELEGYLGRGLRHGNLVQYLSMQHHLSNNKIVVEVRKLVYIRAMESCNSLSLSLSVWRW